MKTTIITTATENVAKSKGGRPLKIKNHRGQIFNPKTGKFCTGRRTKITQDCLNKLETAFGYGSTDKEACASAEISTTAFYNYQKENPDFLEKKLRLKKLPNLRARKALVENMEKDPRIAQWWLERKVPAEFGKKDSNTGVAVQVNFNRHLNKEKSNFITEKKNDDN